MFLVLICMKNKELISIEKSNSRKRRYLEIYGILKPPPTCCKNKQIVEKPCKAGETKTRHKCKKTKPIAYNYILNNLRIGWSDFLHLFSTFVSNKKRYCDKLARKNTKNLSKIRLDN